MKLTTKDERSLLLYLETCAVDQCGRVQGCKLNAEDHALIGSWTEKGYIKFGRIPFHLISTAGGRFPTTNWVKLSYEAWKDAHRERKARAKRTTENFEG